MHAILDRHSGGIVGLFLTPLIRKTNEKWKLYVFMRVHIACSRWSRPEVKMVRTVFLEGD